MKNIDYDKLKKELSKYEYISFDIFDTLIIRNLQEPSDLFKLVENEYNNHNKIKIHNWYTTRKKAESEAREISKKEEITIDDIYHQINLDDEIKEKLKKIEIEIEIKVCEKNERVYKIYELCKIIGKKIIITSDMYLNKKIIEKILNKNDIQYYKLYLSSDIQLTKNTGTIFKYIISDLNIANRNLIHFGDNKKSDYINARLNGIKSILIEKKNYLNFENFKDVTIENKFNYNVLKSFINNKKNIEKDYYWQAGYEIFGPLLYGYSKWLESEFVKNKFDKIYFLSRDGYIMQKAFELCSDIKTKYIYASRRALIVPTIWMYDNFEELKNNMFLPRKISVKSFLKKIGLNPEKYKNVIEKNGYTLNDDLYTKNLNEETLLFYKDIKDDVYANSKNEYENLIKYYKNVDFENNVAIVDIGWFGNMQFALQNIMKKSDFNVNMTGYYVGIVPESEKQDILKMRGYLFEKNREELYMKKKFFNSIFEIVFLAHHGSVKKYTSKPEIVELYEYEYENTETENLIKAFQNGALEFVKDFSNSGISNYIEFDEKIALYNFLKFGNYPTQNDINKFGCIDFLDDDVNKLISNKNILYYVFHLRKFKEDFLNSVWKTGFLKNLFKVNLDYYNIIMKSRSKLKRKE